MRLSELVACSGPNADTCRDVDLVAFYFERPGDDLDDTVCKRTRGLALVVLAVLNDREFVAAQPCQYVGFAQRCLEPRRRFSQQGVAYCVTKRVVDVFEPVQIQQQYGKRVAAPSMPCDCLLNFLHNRQAIWQTR
jgi:hypothetical protein